VTTTSLPDDGLANIRREKIGFIFQSFQLIHTLTVFENVEFRCCWQQAETPARRQARNFVGGNG